MATVLITGGCGFIGSNLALAFRRQGDRVATVDATGAGDCFDGAFVARLAAGDDPVSAGRYANAAAAIATTGYGAVDPLPRPGKVDALARQLA